MYMLGWGSSFSCGTKMNSKAIGSIFKVILRSHIENGLGRGLRSNMLAVETWGSEFRSSEPWMWPCASINSAILCQGSLELLDWCSQCLAVKTLSKHVRRWRSIPQDFLWYPHACHGTHTCTHTETQMGDKINHMLKCTYISNMTSS